jgi:hypothetical protein
MCVASDAFGDTVFRHGRPANIDRGDAVPACADEPDGEGNRAVPADELITVLLGDEPHRAVMAWCVGVLIAAVALRERLRASSASAVTARSGPV